MIPKLASISNQSNQSIISKQSAIKPKSQSSHDQSLNYRNANYWNSRQHLGDLSDSILEQISTPQKEQNIPIKSLESFGQIQLKSQPSSKDFKNANYWESQKRFEDLNDSILKELSPSISKKNFSYKSGSDSIIQNIITKSTKQCKTTCQNKKEGLKQFKDGFQKKDRNFIKSPIDGVQDQINSSSASDINSTFNDINNNVFVINNFSDIQQISEKLQNLSQQNLSDIQEQSVKSKPTKNIILKIKSSKSILSSNNSQLFDIYKNSCQTSNNSVQNEYKFNKTHSSIQTNSLVNSLSSKEEMSYKSLKENKLTNQKEKSQAELSESSNKEIYSLKSKKNGETSNNDSLFMQDDVKETEPFNESLVKAIKKANQTNEKKSQLFNQPLIQSLRKIGSFKEQVVKQTNSVYSYASHQSYNEKLEDNQDVTQQNVEDAKSDNNLKKLVQTLEVQQDNIKQEVNEVKQEEYQEAQCLKNDNSTETFPLYQESIDEEVEIDTIPLQQRSNDDNQTQEQDRSHQQKSNSLKTLKSIRSSQRTIFDQNLQKESKDKDGIFHNKNNSKQQNLFQQTSIEDAKSVDQDNQQEKVFPLQISQVEYVQSKAENKEPDLLDNQNNIVQEEKEMPKQLKPISLIATKNEVSLNMNKFSQISPKEKTAFESEDKENVKIEKRQNPQVIHTFQSNKNEEIEADYDEEDNLQNGNQLELSLPITSLNQNKISDVFQEAEITTCEYNLQNQIIQKKRFNPQVNHQFKNNNNEEVKIYYDGNISNENHYKTNSSISSINQEESSEVLQKAEIATHQYNLQNQIIEKKDENIQVKPSYSIKDGRIILNYKKYKPYDQTTGKIFQNPESNVTKSLQRSPSKSSTQEIEVSSKENSQRQSTQMKQKDINYDIPDYSIKNGDVYIDQKKLLELCRNYNRLKAQCKNLKRMQQKEKQLQNAISPSIKKSNENQKINKSFEKLNLDSSQLQLSLQRLNSNQNIQDQLDKIQELIEICQRIKSFYVQQLINAYKKFDNVQLKFLDIDENWLSEEMKRLMSQKSQKCQKRKSLK